MGKKYYIIFVLFAVVCSIALYIICPEVSTSGHWIADRVTNFITAQKTKGLSLEEVNSLLGDEVAVRLTDISDEQKGGWIW